MIEDRSIPKFTPGPWKAHGPHDDPNDMGAAREISSETRDEIALVPIDDIDTDTMAETNANAHLVSSAPDLYAACRRIDEIQRRGHAFRGEWREAKAALQAALAKAEKGGGS